MNGLVASTVIAAVEEIAVASDHNSLTVADRTLLIVATVFGVVVPIGLALFALWSMID